MIRRQSIKFQISPMKDIRGVVGTRSDERKDIQKDGRNDGWTDGRMHTRTDKGHFYSPPLPTSGDNYHQILLIYRALTPLDNTQGISKRKEKTL